MIVTVLATDETEKSGGEEYILKSILDKYLIQEKYREAEKELKNFLSIHRNRNIEVRAHFYLAQSYYFQSRYRKALIEFTMAQENYYRDVSPWIDACFDKIAQE
jgi:TolA-binding protein